MDEGGLTAARSRVANGRALAQCARRLGLGEYLRLGLGEAASGGHDRESNLADALEAVIGAAYVDRGMKAAEKIFERVLLPHGRTLLDGLRPENPKGKLQEVSQRRWRKGPTYRLLRTAGPAHAHVFTVAAVLPDGSQATASAPNKRDAEIMAAEKLLERVGYG
jgi:ribonuclease-3